MRKWAVKTFMAQMHVKHACRVFISAVCCSTAYSSIPETGPQTRLQHGLSVNGQWLSDGSITLSRNTWRYQIRSC